jgi:hypothetical protein
VRELVIGPPTGKLADIAADPLGWIVVYQDEADGAIVLVQLAPDGARRVGDVRIPNRNGDNAFPVVDVVQGATWLAYRRNPDGAGVLHNLTTGEVLDHFGTVDGNNPLAFGNGWFAYQSGRGYFVTVVSLILNTSSGYGHGLPDGLAWVDLAGVPIFVADTLGDQPGMARWSEAGGCVVGENADAGPDRNIARLSADGRECLLWVGLPSFTPQIAYRGAERRHAVVTYGGPGVRLALLEDADFVAPRPPDPPVDRFAIAPDGTVVEDCSVALFGHHPSLKPDSTPDDLTICLHKNVNEQEWRQVLGRQDVFNIFDRSREVGDTGWYLEPFEACRWAKLSFVSGESFSVVGERVEYPSGRRVPWQHTITLYALVHGGVCVKFDPRFPSDYGRAKKYEFHYNAADGSIRFEEWFTPAPGEPDVRLRQINGWKDPHAPAAPYIECPRPEPSEPPDPPEPPPMFKSREQFFAEFKELNAYYAAPEGLQRPGGMVIDTADPVPADVEAMASWGYDLMAGATVESCKARIRQSEEWKSKHPGESPGAHPSPIVGRLTVDERGFLDEGTPV